jgi:hypothetical protein
LIKKWGGKVWGVWFKDVVRCSMMDEQKYIKDFEFKIFDCWNFAFGIQRNFVKP